MLPPSALCPFPLCELKKKRFYYNNLLLLLLLLIYLAKKNYNYLLVAFSIPFVVKILAVLG